MKLIPGLVDGFVTYLRDTRHFSEYTAISYSKDLLQYFEYLAEGSSGDGTEQAIEATRPTIVTYVTRLKRLNYKRSSLARKIATLRSFYKWMVKQGLTGENPAASVKIEISLPRTVKVVTRGQIISLLAVPDVTGFLGARDHAMIQLVCSTGLKVEELVGLNQNDLDLEGDSPNVVVNGRKGRELPLDSAAIVSLVRYLKLRDAVSSQDIVPLFINKHGTRISTRSFRRKLDTYLAMAGIDVTVSPSTLRHTYALELVQSGASAKRVKEILGITTTSTAVPEYAGSY